ncbi:MAG: 5'-3' exoribonuclease [Phycisphaerae bacterium]|nr:5'-3' exoribonuclease [Phycisphaerae bacterium]
MAFVDLHAHSTASDGSDTPGALMQRAASAGLEAIALTDHDTVAGVAEARPAADDAGVELVPGIEISARMPGWGDPGELHILGLLIDETSPSLLRMNDLLLDARARRNEVLLARLAELHMPVSRDELEAISDGVISRAHIAERMVANGYVATTRQAFDRHIGPGGDAWFDKARLTPSQAFETIHQAGGLAILAHPVHNATEPIQQLETLIGRLADVGLDGLEAFHPDQDPAWVRRVQQWAGRFGLCITGGSDFHGPQRMGRPLNSQRVDAVFLDELKQRLAQRRSLNASSQVC